MFDSDGYENARRERQSRAVSRLNEGWQFENGFINLPAVANEGLKSMDASFGTHFRR
jgi:hypothetical protein